MILHFDSEMSYVLSFGFLAPILNPIDITLIPMTVSILFPCLCANSLNIKLFLWQ